MSKSPPKILAITTHYHKERIDNIDPLLQSLRNQTVPVSKIIVVDNSPNPYGEVTETSGYQDYPNPSLIGADDVWRIQDNLGCPCKLAPAFMLSHEYDYILMVDDDLIPGTRAVEHLIKAALLVNNQFSTISTHARLFLAASTGYTYSGRNTPNQSEKPNPCHSTCRAHLLRTGDLHRIIQFRCTMRKMFGQRAIELCNIHDDLLICLGLQHDYGYRSYITHLEPTPEHRLIKENLPEPKATWKRPNHFAERTEFIQMALACGWRSLV